MQGLKLLVKVRGETGNVQNDGAILYDFLQPMADPKSMCFTIAGQESYSK